MLNYVGLKLGFVCSVHKTNIYNILPNGGFFPGDESHGKIRNYPGN